MNTNAPQAHIDNARNKLSTLLNQLCAADHATTETTVESITKVANTLHYLCQPSSTYGYSNAPGPSPEVGESPSTATASPDASPEPTPKVEARDDCTCLGCIIRRASEVKVIEVPINFAAGHPLRDALMSTFAHAATPTQR